MKTKKIKITSSAAPPSTETETPVDQLYAQVDKKRKDKKKDKEPTSSPETAVDQLYAQVDKKKQKIKEKEVCPEESGGSVLCSQQTQSPSGTNEVTGTPGGTVT